MSVDYHRHCQATVLGATGDPHLAGSTWSTISDLVGNLENIEMFVPNWLNYFTENNNITEDLKAILELINHIAGQGGGGGGGGGGDGKTYWLQFFTNNGDLIDKQKLDPASPLNTVNFNGFGRNVKIQIGGQFVKFNTIKPNTYHNDNGQLEAENLVVTIPEQKPLAGDLINIGSDGRTVSVNNNISQGYTGLVGVEPVGNGNKRRLVEKSVTIPDPYLTQRMFDQLYPIGTVYITVNSEKPFQGYPGITSDWIQIAKGQVLWGCENDGEIERERGPGLPNIKGYFGSRGLVPGNPNSLPNDPPEVFTAIDSLSMPTNSPIYPKWPTTGSHDADQDYLAKPTKRGGNETSTNAAGWYGLGFNAQRYNSIYGNSDTVQPPALIVKFWKRIS